MRKLALGLAALAAISIAIPYAALADTVVVHKHRHPIFNTVLPPRNHLDHHHDRTIIRHHD
jgi:hypothetical protein